MSRSFPFTLLALLSLLIVFVFSSLPLLTSAMAEPTTKHPEPEEATVQIVYVQKPETEEPEAFHIQTLAAVLGSEDAAKESLIYHYTHAASGFSAKLTKSQVEELSNVNFSKFDFYALRLGFSYLFVHFGPEFKLLNWQSNRAFFRLCQVEPSASWGEPSPTATAARHTAQGSAKL
ncbi:hypothetical protein ZIOFF_020063 [Zingiber officinale]|uniref:Inhibitor I9 domain-containing protein n=1 Tax=Zingiber officinale TaxID=94328 RepID=A0A8J5HAM6_ZINOF|nr:hypothetical protein ZIOFF_020063 [Zingiber officinale]